MLLLVATHSFDSSQLSDDFHNNLAVVIAVICVSTASSVLIVDMLLYDLTAFECAVLSLFFIYSLVFPSSRAEYACG